MRMFWHRQPFPGGRAFHRFLEVVGLTGLFFLGGCAYELPAQPTIFVAEKMPDNLTELLKNPSVHQGQIAVLGGQIPRRVDTPVGRYFLIRNLRLGENSYPMPSPPIRIQRPPVDTAFVLFAPSLKMMGGTKPASDREKSAFVVFGRHNNKTMVIGPGHLVTAVGEVRGRVPFPGGRSRTHYLLLVSHYIMLWSQARTEDYPLVLMK